MVSPPDLRTGEEEGPGAGGMASRPGAQVAWLHVPGAQVAWLHVPGAGGHTVTGDVGRAAESGSGWGASRRL